MREGREEGKEKLGEINRWLLCLPRVQSPFFACKLLSLSLPFRVVKLFLDLVLLQHLYTLPEGISSHFALPVCLSLSLL